MINLLSPQGLRDMFPWGAPQRVSTKHGSFVVRRTLLTPEFKRFWKDNQKGLYTLGVSVKKVQGVSIVEWMRDLLSENQERKEWLKEVKQFVKKHLGFKINKEGLRSYQEIAVKRNIYALKKFHFSLEASDTGYGKTYVAFAIARHLGYKIAVVAPKSTLTFWERTAEHMKMLDQMLFKFKRGSSTYYAINIEKLKTGSTSWGHFKKDKQTGMAGDWVWKLPPKTLLVLDELHRFKGIHSQNAEVFIAAARQKIPTLGMSATVANDPSHMRGLGKILKLHDGTTENFLDWARRHGCQVHWSGTLKYYGGVQVLSKLHKEIFPEHGNRQRIADLEDFPDTQIIADVYDMGKNTKHITQAYKWMERELEKAIAQEAGAMNPLTILLRARQKIELMKVPAIVEMAQDAIAEDMSVAIFVNFNETVQQIGKALKTKCFIWGSNGKNERQQRIDDFQADKERVIICNIRAGGVGIGLHDLNGKYARLALISPSWSAQDLVQALGRVHRNGGKTKSIQKVIFAAKTVEEQVCKSVNEKLKDLYSLNDGDMNAGVRLF